MTITDVLDGRIKLLSITNNGPAVVKHRGSSEKVAVEYFKVLFDALQLGTQLLRDKRKVMQCTWEICKQTYIIYKCLR